MTSTGKFSTSSTAILQQLSKEDTPVQKPELDINFDKMNDAFNFMLKTIQSLSDESITQKTKDSAYLFFESIQSIFMQSFQGESLFKDHMGIKAYAGQYLSKSGLLQLRKHIMESGTETPNAEINKMIKELEAPLLQIYQSFGDFEFALLEAKKSQNRTAISGSKSPTDSLASSDLGATDIEIEDYDSDSVNSSPENNFENFSNLTDEFLTDDEYDSEDDYPLNNLKF